MTTVIKSHTRYRERSTVNLSIKFSVLILLHDDYSETHPEPVEPLIKLDHYTLLMKKPKRIRDNEINMIFNECYEEAFKI